MNKKVSEFKDMAGVYSAMISPFTKDGKLNEGAIEQLVEYGIESGLKGFYLTGGTGEFTLMSVEERKKLYRRAAKVAKGRCKLIAHVGATRTDEAALCPCGQGGEGPLQADRPCRGDADG